MPLIVTRSRLAAVDSHVKAFEAAWYRDGSASVADFLPPRTDPLYRKVARELFRVDLEMSWDCGRPRSLDEYRNAFPDLFGDPKLVQVIAFEEYRQRREHGEAPDPDDYARRYGVQTEDWPRAAAAESDRPEATVVTDDGHGMEAASLAYRQFRQSQANEPAKEFELADPRTGIFPEVADLFRAVHAADPAAAEHLAEATLAMPQAGSHFLGFKLVEELGRGAFGRVFLAHQADLADRPVARKISADLQSESQTLAQLQHTNIVPIYSVHRAGNFQAVCMPYFGATTLADVLRTVRDAPSLPASGRHLVSTLNIRRNPTRLPGSESPPSPLCGRGAGGEGAGASPSPPALLPQRGEGRKADAALDALGRRSYVHAVLWLMAKLADGLAHAHERGILHRDLKPANVLLTDDGQPMLLDFNLSDDTKNRGGASGARVGGTLPYMAPEQMEAFRGDSVVLDARSDVFSLGVILFELLTGKFPFPIRRGPLPSSLPLMVLDRRQALPRLMPHNPAVTPAVDAIVRRCLAPEPADRYQSARELQEDLERHLADLPLRHTPEPSQRERFRKWVRRHPRVTSSTTVGAAAGVLFLAFASCAATFWQKHRTELAAVEREQARRSALDQADRVRQAKHELQPLVNYPDRAAMFRVADLARQSLAGYGLPDESAWLESRAVANLSPADRERFNQDAAEMLLTWAEAQRLLAEGESDAGRRTEQLTLAWRLTERADESLGQQPCKALWQQRAQIAYLLHPDDADELDEKAEAIAPQTVLDHFLQARDCLRCREFRRALPELQEVTRLDPQHFWAWFFLGNCHSEAAKLAEAIDCYSACVGMNPPPVAAYQAHIARARVYLNWGRLNLAEADLDRADELASQLPTDHRPHEQVRLAQQRARLLERKGNIAAAETVLTGALEWKVDVADIHLERARLRDRLGDRRGAQHDRSEAVDSIPTDEAGWNTRGLAELPRNPLAALADFEKAPALNSRYYPALQNKAHVLSEKLDKPDEAMAILNRIVDLYPGYVPARIGRGVVYARQGKRAKAHTDAVESLARDRSPATYYQAANIYALTSRQEPADRERVIPLLAVALCNGFGLDLIEDDHDMDPVREQYAFQRLVAVVRQIQSDLLGK